MASLTYKQAMNYCHIDERKHHDCDTYKYLYIIDNYFSFHPWNSCAYDHIRKWKQTWIHIQKNCKQEEVGTKLGL